MSEIFTFQRTAAKHRRESSLVRKVRELEESAPDVAAVIERMIDRGWLPREPEAELPRRTRTATPVVDLMTELRDVLNRVSAPSAGRGV